MRGVLILTPACARLVIAVCLVATASRFVTLDSLAFLDESRVQVVRHVKLKRNPQPVDSLGDYLFRVHLAHLLALVLFVTIGTIWAIFARDCDS